MLASHHFSSFILTLAQKGDHLTRQQPKTMNHVFLKLNSDLSEVRAK